MKIVRFGMGCGAGFAGFLWEQFGMMCGAGLSFFYMGALRWNGRDARAFG